RPQPFTSASGSPMAESAPVRFRSRQRSSQAVPDLARTPGRRVAMARTDAGFTLIEAMAVLALLAISLTLGLPALTGTLDRQRLATSLHLVSADMAMARSSAIMRREQV